MDSLYKASYQVMVNEEEGMSTKLRQLVMAGLIKEKKDLPYFKSAMKKVKGGAVTSVQERQVLINVLNQFLDMIDEAPEFFNLMRRELAKGKLKKEESEIGESWEEDRAMAAQKAQMPASLGGTHKDRSANKASTQVIKKKSQYARPQSEDYANANVKKDEGHRGDKKGGDKMHKLKKVSMKESMSGDVVHEIKSDKGTFQIRKRETSGGGSQDKFTMHAISKNGSTHHWGSHPSLSGAKKFAASRGYAEELDVELAHEEALIENDLRDKGVIKDKQNFGFTSFSEYRKNRRI
tara:strand:+ start:946 stop:1824 length:879 start_codon:yes stop_codon:yes gene_type:complete